MIYRPGYSKLWCSYGERLADLRPGSALSLRALPPKQDPTNLLIFGSGAQAHAHARVFLRLFPSFTSCTVVIRSSTARSEALLSDLRKAFPKININLGVASKSESDGSDKQFNLSQAVHNASVILTLVPTTTPLFNSVDVTSGTHLVLVGSYKPEMRDVDDHLIHRAGIVVVDSKEACSQEAGELIRAGLGSDSESLVELGELFGQDKGGAEDLRSRIQASGDVTIFKSVSDQSFSGRETEKSRRPDKHAPLCASIPASASGSKGTERIGHRARCTSGPKADACLRSVSAFKTLLLHR